VNKSLILVSLAILVLAALGVHQQHEAAIAQSQVIVAAPTPANGFSVLQQGTHLPVSFGKQAQEQVIKTVPDWNAFWPTMYSDGQRPPTISFADHTVIFVTSVSRPTTGYGIAVQSIVRQGNDATVYIDETKPGPQCRTGQSVSQPYEIINVPAPCGKVTFIRLERVVDCR
jgi:hypothetical protein